MERRGLLKAAILMCLLVLCSGREPSIKHKPSTTIYNSTLAKTLVEYASAIYTADLTQLFTWTCARCGDLIEGFEMIEIIVDVENCLQAYVGFASDINAVIVVFRGTQENSIQNWIEDLLWKQLDLDYPGMPEAMVNYGLDGVKLMTFGQPRIGNAAFASYFKRYLPHAIRVTHVHDIVPHLPPYFTFFPQKTYHHFPREVWVHNIGLGSLIYSVEQICDDSGEDPACSRSVSGNSVQDHINYLGVSMHAEAWSSCRIVMDYSTLRYEMDIRATSSCRSNLVCQTSKNTVPNEKNVKMYSSIIVGKCTACCLSVWLLFCWWIQRGGMERTSFTCLFFYQIFFHDTLHF